MIRNRCNTVLPGDICQPQPLGDFNQKFDLISSHLCLECASKSLSDYRDNLVRLATLFKPKDSSTDRRTVVLTAGDEIKAYTVGENTFNPLPMTGEDVVACVAQVFDSIALNRPPFSSFIFSSDFFFQKSVPP